MEGKKLYYRLCSGFADIGKLLPINEDPYQHMDTLNKSWFKSIYFYNEEQKRQFNEEIQVGSRSRKRGVAGITDVVTNKLVFDFDSSEDLEAARADSISLIERLMSHGIEENSIQTSFSGKKGFGIEVAFNDIWLTPPELKTIFLDLTEGLKTSDSVIVNPSRIFRIPLTQHQDSKLYKMPITFDELKNVPIEQIKEGANGAYDIEIPIHWKSCSAPDTIRTIKEIVVEKPKITVVAGKEHRLDFSKMPKGFTKWKYALLNGYFPNGTRSNALIILGSTLRYLGYPETVAYYMLKSAADLQSQRFESDKFSKEEIYTNIVSQVYGPAWKGGMYTEENFPIELQTYMLEAGVPRQRKNTNDDGLQTIDDVFDKFNDFATNIDANTIRTGIDGIDDKIRLTTGMLVGLLGSAGSGKTSLSLEILSAVSKNDEKALFFSLDMGGPLIYQKLSQKYGKVNSDQLFNLYKVPDEHNLSKIHKIRSDIKSNFENTQFTFKTAVSVEQMRDQITDFEEETGEKLKLIVVDYLECIPGMYSDSTANGAYNANALKDLATELDVCVVLLLQTQKSSGDVSEPLQSMRKVKGASVIEQACSIILSIWRPGFSVTTFEQDMFMTIAAVKNRLGGLFQHDFAWDGLQGTISQLPENEKELLEDIRKAKAKQKIIEGVL